MPGKMRIGWVVLAFTACLLQIQGQSASSAPTGGAGAQSMGQMHREMHPGRPAGPLKISFGEKSAEWTPEKLAALPHITVTVFNQHAKANQSYSGVPLFELLKSLGFPENPHGRDLRLYILAAGSDGYAVVYGGAEVTPALHDATVLVADSMDGKPLGEAGPLQLIATGEKHPARWVRNLESIQVRTAE